MTCFLFWAVLLLLIPKCVSLAVFSPARQVYEIVLSSFWQRTILSLIYYKIRIARILQKAYLKDNVEP
jgi:hypothetical protein